jgi:hypothetical protein
VLATFPGAEVVAVRPTLLAEPAPATGTPGGSRDDEPDFVDETPVDLDP